MDMENSTGKLTRAEYKKDIKTVRAFLAKEGYTWPQAAQKSIEEITRNRFLVFGFPVNVLLDPEGKVVALDIGAGLEQQLAKLLPDKPVPAFAP